MSEKRPCVLEGAAPGATHDETSATTAHPPCALLCPASLPASPSAATRKAPPEDESADPVGDGHSDAEWAARHPRGSA